MKLREIIMFGAAAAFVLGSAFSAQAEDRRITIINNTGKRIVFIAASPIDQKNWTFNMLDTVGHPLYAHDSIVADIDDGTGYCRYDLIAKNAAGQVAVKYDANVCEAVSWTINE